MPLSQPTILPPTLVDQIRLWELERERLFFQEGCLYEQFAKNTDFEMVRDFAKASQQIYGLRTKAYENLKCHALRCMVVLEQWIPIVGMSGAPSHGRLQSWPRRRPGILEAEATRVILIKTFMYSHSFFLFRRAKRSTVPFNNSGMLFSGVSLSFNINPFETRQ